MQSVLSCQSYELEDLHTISTWLLFVYVENDVPGNCWQKMTRWEDLAVGDEAE